MTFWEEFRKGWKDCLGLYGAWAFVCACTVMLHVRYDVFTDGIAITALSIWVFGLPVLFALDMAFVAISRAIRARKVKHERKSCKAGN